MRARILAVLSVAGLAVVGCGSSSSRPALHDAARPTVTQIFWQRYVHIKRVLDLAGPRADGSMIVAANGRLFSLSRSGRLRPFATGYVTSAGLEAYIAVAGGCFARTAVYAIHFRSPRGIVEVDPSGRVRRLASLRAPGLINGIAYDGTGRFGHRLVVTVNDHHRTTVYAIGCHGTVQTITSRAPRVEGGVAVAPAGFGPFGGDLIAPDEIGGGLYAITPRGGAHLLASSGLPHGQDIGVESEGFVPAGARAQALVADRGTPGNHHPGDDQILRLPPARLAAVGVRAGDLVVVSEGGALTEGVRCRASGCSVREVAIGPAEAHIEGHVAFRNP